MPAGPSVLDRASFIRPIAHRGLHDAGAGIIENTGPAFGAAIAGGYGIECDLRPAANGLPIVFHDATLNRLVDPPAPWVDCSASNLVANLSLCDIAQLQYRGTTAPLLTFAQLLDLVGGRVPLLVEIKSEWQPPDHAFLHAIADLALSYRGPLALMSFDPAVMAICKDLAPSLPRGLVSGSYRGVSGDGWWSDVLDATRAAQLRDLEDFAAVAASFVAYEVGALPTPVISALRASGTPAFAWTVRTPAQQAHAARHADAVIFENLDAL